MAKRASKGILKEADRQKALDAAIAVMERRVEIAFSSAETLPEGILITLCIKLPCDAIAQGEALVELGTGKWAGCTEEELECKAVTESNQFFAGKVTMIVPNHAGIFQS